MKNKITALFVAALAAVSLTGASAADRPFSFTVDGNTLHIFAPDGKEVGTGLPPATIGKTIDVPPYSFQVSFGTDANGNLSVIITPNPEHPTPLEFTVNGRDVQMDRSSVVTITLGNNGVTTVDPGITGGVKVDNRTTMAAPAGANGIGSSTTVVASNNGVPPSQQPPDPQGTQGNNAPGDLNKNALLDPLNQASGNPLPPAFNSSGGAVAVNNPTNPNATTPF